MDTWLYVLIFSLAGGVLSLAASLLLISKKSTAEKMVLYATPFAAGALLAAAFIDLLPEAGEHGSIDKALFGALGGIVVFFLLERFLHWFHHHENHQTHQVSPSVFLIIIGDTLHNFIDGIAIAAGFLIDVQTGMVVTLAVAAHEIPQEIGDFGLLLSKGMKRASVIKVNLLSAFATTFSAILFYTVGQNLTLPMDYILGLIAGFFIYISVSDIIPNIHRTDHRFASPQTFLLLLGVVAVGLATTFLHGFIEI